MEDRLQLAIEIITKNADAINKVSRQLNQLNTNAESFNKNLRSLDRTSTKVYSAFNQLHSSVRGSNSAFATLQRTVGSTQRHLVELRNTTRETSRSLSSLNRSAISLNARFSQLVKDSEKASRALVDFERTTRSTKAFVERLARAIEKIFKSVLEFHNQIVKATRAVAQFTRQVQVGATVLERQKKLTDEAATSLREFHAGMNQTDSSTKKASRSLLGFIGRCVKFTLVFTTVYETIQLVGQALKEFVLSGARFNETIDAAKIGIAALVATNTELVDAFGRVVPETEQFQIALKGVDSQIAILRRGAIQTSATLGELVTAYQMAVGYGLSAGLSLEQIADLTVRITQAAEALRMPFHGVYEEIRSILAGTITQHSLIAKMLGLSNALVNQWKQQGILYEKLSEKLRAFVAAGKEYQNTWSGIFSRVQDVSSLFMGLATSSIWKELKAKIKDALSSLYDFNTDTFNEKLRGLAMLIHDTLSVLSIWVTRIFSIIGKRLIDLSVAYERHRNIVITILEKIGKAWAWLAGNIRTTINAAYIINDVFTQLGDTIAIIVIAPLSKLLQLTANLIGKIPFLRKISEALRKVAEEGLNYVNFYVNQFNATTIDMEKRWIAIEKEALGYDSILSRLPESTLRLRGELAALSVQLGVSIDSVDKLNFLLQNGIAVWDETTNHYRLAEINLQALSERLGVSVDSYGTLIELLKSGVVVWDSTINQYVTAEEFLNKIAVQTGLAIEKYSTFKQLLESGVIVWDAQTKQYSLNADALDAINVEIGQTYSTYGELLNAIENGRVVWDANRQQWVDAGNILTNLEGGVLSTADAFSKLGTQTTQATDVLKKATQEFSEVHKELKAVLDLQLSTIEDTFEQLKAAGQDPDVKAILDLAEKQAEAITTYFAKATAAANHYFSAAKGGEAKLLEARKEIYTNTYNSYKALIDKLIAEEKKRRDKAKEIEDYIKDLRKSTSEWIRDLKRKEMDAEDEYYDRVEEIEENIRKARKAETEGSLKVAQKYYETALEKSKELATSITKDEKVAKEAREEAISYAIRLTEDLARVAEKAAQKEKEEADLLHKRYTELQGTLGNVKKELDQISQQKLSISLDQEKIAREVERAKAKIRELDGIVTHSTHIIHVKKVEEKAYGGLIDSIKKFASGGVVFRRLLSRYIPGWGSKDNVPALLQRGEYVIRKEAVKKYGLAFIEAINKMRLPVPKFQAGGAVDEEAYRIVTKQLEKIIKTIRMGTYFYPHMWLKDPEPLSAHARFRSYLEKLRKLILAGFHIEKGDLIDLINAFRGISYAGAGIPGIGALTVSWAGDVIKHIEDMYNVSFSRWTFKKPTGKGKPEKIATVTSTDNFVDTINEKLRLVEKAMLVVEANQRRWLGFPSKTYTTFVAVKKALEKLKDFIERGRLSIREKDLKDLVDSLWKYAFYTYKGKGIDTKAAKAIIDEIVKKYNLPVTFRFAKGGLVDTIPALLSRGEYVLNRDAVKYYGLSFIESLNKMQIPKFATGGFVGTSPATSSTHNSITLNININATQSTNLNDRTFWERILKEQIIPQLEEAMGMA